MYTNNNLAYYINVAKIALDKSEKDGSNVYSNIHNVLKNEPMHPIRNAGLIKISMKTYSHSDYYVKKFIFN